MTDRVKPGDPIFDELVAKFQSVASSRYVEDPSHRLPTRFIRSETGLRFDELKRGDQIDTLSDSVHWDYYAEKGLSAAQAGIILSNVRKGKPQEKWLDGIFDEAALERHRVEGFKAMVEDSKHSPDNRLFEEMDGDRLPWAKLSATAKLGYIARDAALSDVGFEPFAEMVKDTIGDAVEAALRVVLDGQKELHAIAKLLPHDGRIEPAPLVEQVTEILDYVSVLEQQEKERLQGREKLLEGISNVLDGKPPQGLLEGVKAFQDILRDAHPIQQEAGAKERSRDI
jgi:hypothetical protein